MDKPTLIHRMQFPRGEAFTFDVEAFEAAIATDGVEFIHYRSMACPQGIVNKNDTTRITHADHSGCSNGYLYKRVGPVKALFTGNSSQPQFQDTGAVDGSTATVTMRRRYETGDEQVYLNYADRLYLAESSILWPHWELVEHNIGGFDRLRFPAVRVEHLVDNRGQEYHQDQDFNIVDGQIHWKPGKGPGVDMDSGDDNQTPRGRVYTVWFLYTPYSYIDRISHAIRVIQAENEAGERVATRMPFQATIVRETQFENKQRNDEATSPEDGRELKSSRDGSFAPR